ncbi:MAG: hypothetical protein EOP09_15840, partial [Proteobacteria bacterium]
MSSTFTMALAEVPVRLEKKYPLGMGVSADGEIALVPFCVAESPTTHKCQLAQYFQIRRSLLTDSDRAMDYHYGAPSSGAASTASEFPEQPVGPEFPGYYFSEEGFQLKLKSKLTVGLVAERFGINRIPMVKFEITAAWLTPYLSSEAALPASEHVGEASGTDIARVWVIDPNRLSNFNDFHSSNFGYIHLQAGQDRDGWYHMN